MSRARCPKKTARFKNEVPEELNTLAVCTQLLKLKYTQPSVKRRFRLDPKASNAVTVYAEVTWESHKSRAIRTWQIVHSKERPHARHA